MNISDQLNYSTFLHLLENSSLIWGLLACGFAQLSKLFFHLIFFKEWRPSILIETGGMPSSHSALVTGTAAAIGCECGFDDPIFALASMIAFIVMYDASGVRRAAGLTAKRVNKISSDKKQLDEQLLKENLGHTRMEVLVGSILGPAIALPGVLLIGSPLNLLDMISNL